MDIPFRTGSLYNRRENIHKVFGGQQQGGISTPKNYPFIFLFTGSSGSAYGYHDNWTPEGVFEYVGEGQQGDMEFRGGNRAIRDHSAEGKVLLVFENLGKGKPVRFAGSFQCVGYEFSKGEDQTGAVRKTIVFHLLPSERDTIAEDERAPVERAVESKTLEGLRTKAYELAKDMQPANAKYSLQRYRARSEAVRSYVLKRANGYCESCGCEAPFRTSNGFPYLEAHHTRRLSDDGPDDPRWVAGICPTCHREIHHGENGNVRNLALIDKLHELEPEPGK